MARQCFLQYAEEAVAQRRSVKKVFLKISQNLQENICWSLIVDKETLTQVFFCEFCEIFKNSFFNTTPVVAAS